MNTAQALLGISAAIRSVEEDIEHAARCGAKVLITGESGAGKEIVARLIHDRGARGNTPLVAINCAGVPDSLLESELFGHVKGSFTDAYRDRIGSLERAHCGTVFLDEIGDMSRRMQALLLRFLETGEIHRVGGEGEPSRVDVRVIAATHRRLIQQVCEKTFREDLYYRLNVIHIEVPPLRTRREDIPILLRYFLESFSDTYKLPLPELGCEAARRLAEYDWPGNVRELRNVAERMIIRSAARGVDMNILTSEVLVDANNSAAPRPGAAQHVPTPHALLDRMVRDGESFWAVAYGPFMARDLTRWDIRELVRLGLEQTGGSYEQLAATFNMAPEDYKRFLGFLRKYQCQIPLHPPRAPLPVGHKLIASA